MLTVATEISVPSRAHALVIKDGDRFTVVVAADRLGDVNGGSLEGAPGIHCEAASLDVIEAAYRAGIDAIRQARAKESRRSQGD